MFFGDFSQVLDLWIKYYNIVKKIKLFRQMIVVIYMFMNLKNKL